MVKVKPDPWDQAYGSKTDSERNGKLNIKKSLACGSMNNVLAAAVVTAATASACSCENPSSPV